MKMVPFAETRDTRRRDRIWGNTVEDADRDCEGFSLVPRTAPRVSRGLEVAAINGP